jgi:hypothetical protein
MNNIFICGCGHSGTTLILAILLENPECHGLRIETRAFFNLPENEAVDLIKSYYKNGYRYFVEKTPTNVYKINVIIKNFNDAKIVVCYRHPYDTIASIKRRGFDLEHCINRYVNDNIAWLSLTSPNIIPIKYENVVSNPTATIETLCNSLELKFDTTMLEYYRRTELFFNISEQNYDEYTKEHRNYDLSEFKRHEGNQHRMFRNYQLKMPITNFSNSYTKILSPAELEYIRPKVLEVATELGYVI